MNSILYIRNINVCTNRFFNEDLVLISQPLLFILIFPSLNGWTGLHHLIFPQPDVTDKKLQ